MAIPSIPPFDLSKHRVLDRSLDTNVFDILTGTTRVGGWSKEDAEILLRAIPAGLGQSTGGGNVLRGLATDIAERAHAVYASYGRHTRRYAAERAAEDLAQILG